jgi:DNA polymerase-1
MQLRVYVGDLEANGLLETATKTHCGVFRNRATGEVVKFRPHQIQDMLKFLDTVDVLIMHNGIGYDWPLLEKLYNYKFKGKKVDTLIMSRLLNPNRLLPPNCPNKQAGPNSVEAWGWRVGRGKPQHDDWENFSEEMLHRCSEDVEIQELIYQALLKEANGGNWRNAFLLSFELFENLQKQEQYGWLVDQEHMQKCIRQLTKWIERIDKVITPYLPTILVVEETKKDGQYGFIKKPFLKSGEYSQSSTDWFIRNNIDPSICSIGGCFGRISFRKTDLNSNQETKQFLLEMGWEPLEWNTNDAGERTSPKLSKDDPFEGIESKIGKLVAKRVQCRQRRSIIEGLVNLVRADGRIGSAVNTLAVTARATHRNIVNIPKAGSFYGKQMRTIFTSKDGCVLVGTDSDGCQLRMLAGRMNNPQYTEALVNGDKKLGTDNHSLTAKIGELESRDIAKNTMYCLLFGGADARLAKTAKKQLGSGAALRERLYRGLDGLGDLVEKLQQEWKLTARQRYNPKFRRMEYYDGVITGLDGRPIKVPNEHQLLVYLLQSDEAIMMTKAYNKMYADLNKKYVYGLDFGVVCFYHDEYTVECREEIAEDVRRISEEAIAWAGRFYNISCPHLGQGKIGKNWYSIH